MANGAAPIETSRAGGWDSTALREWAHGLGVETFVGSSGRVFPNRHESRPLLRAWSHRLRHPAAGGGCSSTCAIAGQVGRRAHPPSRVTKR